MAVPKDVTRLIDNFQTHISDYKKMSYKEDRLRKEYLDPFFEALGWDMANKQGHAEAYKESLSEFAEQIPNYIEFLFKIRCPMKSSRPAL